MGSSQLTVVAVTSLRWAAVEADSLQISYNEIGYN